MGIKPIPPLAKMIETDAFGSNRYTKDGVRYPHAGQDLKADIGTPVKAILDGVVVRSFYRKPKTEGDISYGNVIVIYHGENAKTGKHTYSLYAHLSKRDAQVRKKVKRRDITGRSGNTDNVPPHLHLEVMESPYEITWAKTGNEMGNYFYGQHSISPKRFLEKRFLKEPEPFTEAEIGVLHDMMAYDMKEGPSPTFLVKAPEFKEFMKRIRPNTAIAGLEPPIFGLEFHNLFSKKFRDMFPTIALEVNGRKLGRIKTGITNYDLNI